MATLTAGQSATIGLDAWATLTLVVSGSATISFTSQAPSVHPSFNVTTATSRSYGPFGCPMSAVVRAVDRGVTYTIEGGVGGYSRDSAGNVTGLVGPDNQRIAVGRQLSIPGGIWCDWQSGTGTLAMVSTDAGDDVALDSTVPLDGMATVKCTFSNAASGTYIAEFAFTNALSLKNFRTLQVPVKITSSDSASGVALNTAALQVWLYLSGGGTVRLQCDAANVPPGHWHVFSFSRESPSGLVTFSGGATAWTDLDSQTVTKVRIVQGTIAASVDYPVWFGALRCDARAKGAVSIVMDGQYISQYTLIKPLLDQYGLKTSLALVNSDIGGSGRMTAAQIGQLYGEGHECIHHTYDGTKTNGYLNATDWPAAADISADIKNGFDYFIDQGWTRGLGKIVNAYDNPFGKAVATARQKLILAAMRAAGVQCSRASTNLYTTQMSLGYRGVTPFHLRGSVQITSTTTAADIQTIIDQAETNGEWAIITVHRAVESSPSTLEMTTANFRTWIDHLAARVAVGGVTCQPMGEVYDQHFVA